MWIRWMENGGGDVGDSGGALGTGWRCPRPRGRPEERPTCSFSNLLLVLAEFFALSPPPSTGRPPWKPGGSCPQSTTPAPPAPQASRLTYSTHSHNTLRSLASLRGTLLRVCLLVWPLMQFLFSSLLNNQQSG